MAIHDPENYLIELKSDRSNLEQRDQAKEVQQNREINEHHNRPLLLEEQKSVSRPGVVQTKNIGVQIDQSSRDDSHLIEESK